MEEKINAILLCVCVWIDLNNRYFDEIESNATQDLFERPEMKTKRKGPQLWKAYTLYEKKRCCQSQRSTLKTVIH